MTPRLCSPWPSLTISVRCWRPTWSGRSTRKTPCHCHTSMRTWRTFKRAATAIRTRTMRATSTENCYRPFENKMKNFQTCPSFPSVIPPDKREHFMDRGWWQCVNLQTYWCSYVRCSFGVFCCYWRGWGVSACRFLTAKDSWGQMASLRTDVLNYLDRLESGAREWKNHNLFYHWNSWIVCGALYFRTFSQHLFSLPWCQTE